MPNHLHLIWETNKPNGKEQPQGSLLKFTGHPFKKILSEKYPVWLPEFKVEAANKQYAFWQRDALAFPLFSRAVISQKIDYVHLNPVSVKWRLARSSVNYRFSSAAFYDNGIDEFDILTHIGAVFDRHHSEPPNANAFPLYTILLNRNDMWSFTVFKGFMGLF